MTKIVRILAALALLAALTVAAPSAGAGGGPIGYTQRTLATNDIIHRVNLSTGDVVEVGDSMIDPATTALEFHPDGTLFGMNGEDLYTYDPATGVATSVGFVDEQGFRDLAFTPTGELYGFAFSASQLFRIDPTTATIEEGYPILVNGNVLSGMAVGCDGVAYAIDQTAGELVTIDLETAVPTTVGPLGVDVGTASLDYDVDGTLWMLADLIDGDSASFTVDPTTGAATLVATIDINLLTELALNPPTCPDPDPDPEPDPEPDAEDDTATTGAPPSAPATPAAANPTFTG